MEDQRKPAIARFVEKAQLPFRIFAGLLFFDILTKILASELISPGQTFNIMGDFFYLAGDVRNNSGNVGIWSFIWNGAIVAGLYFWKKNKTRSPRLWVPLAMIVAGNLGNIAESLFRTSGVVDWICFSAPFGICTNIADIYIWAGYGTLAAGLVYYIVNVCGKESEKREEAKVI